MLDQELDYATPPHARRPKSWGVVCGVFEVIAAAFVVACGGRIAYIIYLMLLSIESAIRLGDWSDGWVGRYLDASITLIVPFTSASALFLLCRWLRLRPGPALPAAAAIK